MLARTLAALATLILLAACDSTGSLQQLRETPMTGDAYQKALASAYKDYAEDKTQTYEWEASRFFADKGLAAARGAEVGPEDAARWRIPAALMPDFMVAREKLRRAIEANRTTQPEMTASAVLAYDRWVEHQHYGADAGKIAEQRSVFEAVLAKLQEAYAADPATAPTTTIDPASKSAVLYFPLDVDNLGDTALGAIEGLTRYAKSASDTAITVNGHADRTGTEEHNMDLSNRRAMFVVRTLTKSGIAVHRIRHYAFGESDPAVATPDGVPEPKNRRVEISVE